MDSPIKEARTEAGLTQGQLAEVTGYSASAIGHFENNKRKVTEEFAQLSMEAIDCPVYHLEMINHIAKGASSPVLRGKNIERHRLTLRELALQEVAEAITHLTKVNLIKPPQQSTSQERDEIRVAIEEILDAVAGLQNLKAKLAKEYQISIVDVYKKRKPVWKAKGWI